MQIHLCLIFGLVVSGNGWQVNRRDAVFQATSLLSLLPDTLPVLVLGASGKTGRECVQYLLKSGRPCIATTRTGEYNEYDMLADSTFLTVATCDVTNPATVQEVLGKQKLAGVIYAASASKNGGSAMAVDRDGVIEAGRACIRSGVPRFVVVSSGAVSRPDSGIYKLLNSFGRIMEAKIAGEDQVRQMYADSTVLQQNLGYTIVRPGGLTTEPSVGVSNLELNQGDAVSGRLPRADVAAICCESIYDPNTFDVTLECYESSTAKPLEAVGLSNLLKSRDPTVVKTGKERRGDTFASLFEGLERDPGHVL